MNKIRAYEKIKLPNYYQIHRIVFTNNGELKVYIKCDASHDSLLIDFMGVCAYELLKTEKSQKEFECGYGIFEIENSEYKNNYKCQSMHTRDTVMNKMKEFIISDKEKYIKILSISLPQLCKEKR